MLIVFIVTIWHSFSNIYDFYSLKLSLDNQATYGWLHSVTICITTATLFSSTTLVTSKHLNTKIRDYNNSYENTVEAV